MTISITSSSKKFTITFVLILFFSSFIFSTLTLAAPLKNSYPTIKICRPNNMVSATAYIAEAMKYFELYKINVIFEETSNAKLCQDALIAKKVDAYFGAEAPITYLSAQPHNLKIIRSLGINPETAIFARYDSNIRYFNNLVGKKIGYLPGTVSWFFLAKLLDSLKKKLSDVQLVPLQPQSMSLALKGGVVDAISIWQPWGEQAIQMTEAPIKKLAATHLYRYFPLLISESNIIAKKKSELKLVLKAISEAIFYLKVPKLKDSSISILSKKLSYPEDLFIQNWNTYSYTPRTKNEIIEQLNSNFNLLIKFDPNFKNSKLPDFNKIIDFESLK